jgi:hypothetical protein
VWLKTDRLVFFLIWYIFDIRLNKKGFEMNRLKKYTLPVIGILVFSGNVHAQDVDEIISQERAKIIARQISNNISRRISGDVGDATGAGIGQNASLDFQNPLAASADSKSLLPDSAWLTSSWSEISDDDALNVHVDADIYQVTGGVDKQFGDWFVGLSTTYAYTETEIGLAGGAGSLSTGGAAFGSQSHTHTITVTPYVAFVINQNFFISGLTSYSYSRGEPDTGTINLDSDSDGYTTELDFNAIKVIGDWALTGKTGFRYSHTDTYFDKPSLGGGVNLNQDNDADNWTYLVDARVGYSLGRFVKGLRMSAGALYEYVETEDGEDDGVLYMSTGLDYAVSKSFSVGLSYSHDVNNEDIDINSVAFNLRLAL